MFVNKIEIFVMTSAKIIPPKFLFFFMLLVSSNFLMTAQESSDYSLQEIQQAPIYPGCEDLKTNKDRKDCLSVSISKFISENFDYKLVEKLNLSGKIKILVSFKIDTSGEISVVEAKSEHPVLTDEGERIVNLLPKMTPGKHNDEVVGVMYNLPILFQVE